MKTSYSLIRWSLLLGALATCGWAGATEQIASSPGSQAKAVTLLMPSAKVDLTQDTVTLPLRHGHLADGRSVYFVLTDVSDAAKARSLGLVYAPKLKNAIGAHSTRHGQINQAGEFTFDRGTVDFSPTARLVPGDAPNFFPPKVFTPGSVGDQDYSPFVNVDGIVYNAPVLAFNVEPEAIDFCSGHPNYELVHDKVIAICPKTNTVTLALTHGFAAGKEVIYISTDSNNPMPATMETSTYTPATADLGGKNADETLYAFANGATGKDNPERQGFNSALGGEGTPLNILEALRPSSHAYSPLWDIQVAVWTDAAITKGDRKRLTSGQDAEAAMAKGDLMSPMGGAVTSLGLLVNCPVIGFLN